jgi:hypothetical protein
LHDPASSNCDPRAPDPASLTESMCESYLRQRSNNRAKYLPEDLDKHISATNRPSAGKQMPIRNKRRKRRNVTDSSTTRVQDAPKPILPPFHITTKTSNHSLPEVNWMGPYPTPLRNDFSKLPTEPQFSNLSPQQWSIAPVPIDYGEVSGCAENRGRNIARNVRPTGHPINNLMPTGRFNSMVMMYCCLLMVKTG